MYAEFLTPYSKLKSIGSAYLRIIEAWPHKAGCYLHVCVIFCPHSVGMLLFTYQGKDWHSFTPSVCLTEVWKATVDKRKVSKGMWLSQYAPKGVKSLCITSSQTVYVRKPDLVSSKTLERLGGLLICKIYLNTYFQRARLGGRLICEIGLYASICNVFYIQALVPLKQCSSVPYFSSPTIHRNKRLYHSDVWQGIHIVT